MRRVVITGLGTVGPLGNSVKESWDCAVAGKSGIKTVDRFDTSGLSSTIAGMVVDFDVNLAMSSKDARRYDPFIQYAVEAGRQAFEDAGIIVGVDYTPDMFGVAIGSGIGGLNKIVENQEFLAACGAKKVSPFFIPGSIINMPTGLLSIKYGLMGPSFSVVSACASGAHNIGEAFRIIRDGTCDAMLAGGSEMVVNKLSMAGFCAIKALSKRNDDPKTASRPWDSDRDGFVLGEGAGAIILEEYESAKKRSAKIYGEIIGVGMSSDAYHITAPDKNAKGFCLAMRKAFKDAARFEIGIDDVDYVNAHGTSTILGDEAEVVALKEVFGNFAHDLMISSTKSMTGHTLGAAGAIEAIYSLLAIRDSVVPPTINLEKTCDFFDLNFVPNKCQEAKVKVVMSNSFGFGGTNASLIFRSI